MRPGCPWLSGKGDKGEVDELTPADEFRRSPEWFLIPSSQYFHGMDMQGYAMHDAHDAMYSIGFGGFILPTC
jgi:hypothetical protein